MTIPHIGSTGVIQDPGVLGTAATALQGLPQILLALQQQKAQQSRDAISAQLAHAQIHNYDVDNQRQQAQIDQANQLATALGLGQQALTTPEITPPSMSQPGPQLQVGTQGPLSGQVLPTGGAASKVTPGSSRQRTVNEVAAMLPPIARKTFYDDKTVQEYSKREEEQRKQGEILSALEGSTLDPVVKSYLKTMVVGTGTLAPGLQTEGLKLAVNGGTDPENIARAWTISGTQQIPIGRAFAQLKLNPAILTNSGQDPNYIPPVKQIQAIAFQDQIRPPSAEEGAAYQAFQTMRVAEKGIRALPKAQYMSDTQLASLSQQIAKPGFNIKGALAALVQNNPATEAYLPFLEPELRRIVGTRSGQQPSTVMNSLKAFLPMTYDSPTTLKQKERLRTAMIEAQGIGGNRLIKNGMGKESKELLRDDELDAVTPPGFK